MKHLQLVLFILLPAITYAQKRNVISAGFDWDYLLESKIKSHTSANNIFKYSIHYERLVGQRLSVGLSYFRFISGTDDLSNGFGYTPESVTYSPDDISGTFTQKMSGISYESRFYFYEPDQESLRGSGYVGFSYGVLFSSIKMSGIIYKVYNPPGTILIKTYPEKNFMVTRAGAKIGYVASGALNSDLYVGLFYNMSTEDKSIWNSPTIEIPVSVIIGWKFGIPF